MEVISTYIHLNGKKQSGNKGGNNNKIDKIPQEIKNEIRSKILLGYRKDFIIRDYHISYHLLSKILKS